MSEARGVGDIGPQRTLRHAIGCVGVGLHSGARTALTLHPAEIGHGIRFRRADRPGTATIAAVYDNVVDTTLCTTLGLPGGPRVAMVEHILAAFAACEIDNALIDVSGPEIPVMDGSAQPFVFLIECAGIVEQDEDRPVIEVLKRVSASAELQLGCARAGRGVRARLPHRVRQPADRHAGARPPLPARDCFVPRSPPPAPSASPRRSRTCARAAWPWAAR